MILHGHSHATIVFLDNSFFFFFLENLSISFPPYLIFDDVNPVGLGSPLTRYVKELASIFSSDPAVIDLFQECRLEMGLMSLG